MWNDSKHLSKLDAAIKKALTIHCQSIVQSNGEITIEIEREKLLSVARLLKESPELQFKQLIDVCAVDYNHHGMSEWETEEASGGGFSRAADRESFYQVTEWTKPRYAVVYHLLSVSLNQRCRLRVYLNENDLVIPSVVPIWRVADWFEREAFDLFGILFEGHPDLRRILTDYGFIGHPFRKDFPVSGHVEMRYDAAQGRVVYEPVSITPRVLVPKVIRQNNNHSSSEDDHVRD